MKYITSLTLKLIKFFLGYLTLVFIFSTVFGLIQYFFIPLDESTFKVINYDYESYQITDILVGYHAVLGASEYAAVVIAILVPLVLIALRQFLPDESDKFHNFVLSWKGIGYFFALSISLEIINPTNYFEPNKQSLPFTQFQNIYNACSVNQDAIFLKSSKWEVIRRNTLYKDRDGEFSGLITSNQDLKDSMSYFSNEGDDERFPSISSFTYICINNIATANCLADSYISPGTSGSSAGYHLGNALKDGTSLKHASTRAAIEDRKATNQWIEQRDKAFTRITNQIYSGDFCN